MWSKAKGNSELVAWAPMSRSDRLLCGSREDLTTSPLDRGGTVEMSDCRKQSIVVTAEDLIPRRASARASPTAFRAHRWTPPP
jgi:hypothetical protein